MQSRTVRLLLVFALAASASVGCHRDEHAGSRFRTLKVDEHGHVHDPNDGHDHGHDDASEKRIASH